VGRYGASGCPWLAVYRGCRDLSIRTPNLGVGTVDRPVARFDRTRGGDSQPLHFGTLFSVTAKATALVTWGIYSRVRNPIYVQDSFHCRAILMIGRPEGLVLLLALIPMQIVRARREATVWKQSSAMPIANTAKAHGSEICCPGLPPPRCYHFSNEIQRRINESTMSTPTPTAAPKPFM